MNPATWQGVIWLCRDADGTYSRHTIIRMKGGGWGWIIKSKITEGNVL